MYRIGLSRAFRARHYLVGSDRGEENVPHAHPYRMEWDLGGPELDDEGFLADLAVVGRCADRLLADLDNKILNDLPAFRGGNPTVERLARYLWERLAAERAQWDPWLRVTTAEVRVFESDAEWGAWAADLGRA